jgi:hypothetical protein
MRKKEYPYQNLSLKDMKGEVWEDIPGLDGYYCISNYGRVKRGAFEILRKDGAIMHMQPRMSKTELTLIRNNSINDNVYFLRAKIMQSGKKYNIGIARLVYYCFIKKFDLSNHHLVVLAKDCNGKNVHPDNLILVDLSKKQKRIFERNRLIKTFYYTYDEFIQEGVEKSVNPYCKQVTQYTTVGKKIKTFPSIRAAAITLDISEVGINSVLKERQVTYGGFVWRYGNARYVDMKSFWENKKTQFHKKTGQKVTQYDLNGKRIACYLAIAEAVRTTGAGSGEICNVINGKQRTAGGFIWKKGTGKPSIDVSNFVYGAAWRGQKRQKKVKQYTLTGKYIQTFESVKAAAAFVGIKDSAVSIACHQGHRTCKGYKWRYT